MTGSRRDLSTDPARAETPADPGSRSRSPCRRRLAVAPAPFSFFSGRSVTSVSVVRTIFAIEAAFWRAERVTLAASTIPFSNMSPNSPLRASKPWPLAWRTWSTMTSPRAPALSAIWRIGSSRARRTMSTPTCVVALELELVERRDRLQEGRAAAGDDALLDRRAGGREGVLDAVLLLLELDLGRRADLDDGDAAGELGEALLELLAVVVRGGLLDLRLDLVHAGLDVGLAAGAVDDRGVVLGGDDAAGLAEVLDGDGVELAADLLGDDRAAGEDRDVAQHLLAPIAEARGLDGQDLDRAAELVDDERGERLAVDVLGDDQRAAGRPGRPSRAPAGCPRRPRSSCR